MASDVTTQLEATPANFKELFDLLSSQGEFRCSRMADGRWYALLKLPTPKGITVEISTPFVPTAMAALVGLSALLDDLRAGLAEGRVKVSAPEWFDVAAQLFTIAAILVLMWLITRMQKMCDQLIADSLRDLAEITRLRLALIRAGLFNDVLPPK